MAKRGPSKADLILNEARRQLTEAAHKLNEARQAFLTAQSVHYAQQQTYDALERMLVKPKKATAPKSVPSAGKKSSPKKETANSTQNIVDDTVSALPVNGRVLCGICGNVEEYQDHSRPSPDYHPFQTTKKRGKSEPVILPDDPENFLSGATA